MNKGKIFIIKMIVSFFFLGYLSFLPGTITSFICLFFVWFLRGSFLFYLSLLFLTIILGFITTTKAEKIFNKKDCQKIVIDEAAGVFLSFLLVPLDLKSLSAGFIIFRILDAVKIFPAYFLERLSGAKGIMFDDLVAGIYTNIILQVVFRFLT
ncbi:MAG: phosphatidylglycerophosphatase A [Candidatus Omnitrophica bacterium]|nr:phosphatidylglycerophosphatase A [Candidatus Omnitrophota bacterium]